MKRTLINLLGRKRSGKETAFRLLFPLTEQPAEFQFATPLKKFCMEALGLTHDQCYGPDIIRESLTPYRWKDIDPEIRESFSAKDEFLTARQVLQIVGTNLLRNKFYKKIWAEAAIRAAVSSSAATCIFTDGRFVNEIEAVKDVRKFDQRFEKILNIRVYRETKLTDSHESETALDIYDLIPNQRKIEVHQYGQLMELGYHRIGESIWKSKISDNAFDYLIDNNSSIERLRDSVVTLLQAEGLTNKLSPS